MKYVISFGIIFALALSFATADAAIVSGDQSVTSYTVDTTDIVQSSVTGDIRFSFDVTDIQNPQNISYWKIRSYCDEDMRIGVVASSTDECGEAVDFKTLPDNKFAIWFENKTNTTRNFSFKLKAYDANGDWLHTQQKSFSWK